MTTYTLKFKQHDQDNLNIIPFTKESKNQMPSFLDYDEILERSISAGTISSEDEIQCLMDGSDHIEPLFLSRSASEEAQTIVEDDFNETFDAETTEYELY